MFFFSVEDELITSYAPKAVAAGKAEGDGRLTSSSAHRAAGQAQRIAEGASLQIHRNTWRYNKLVEHQRELVLEHRDRVLHTDAAVQAFTVRYPDRVAELAGSAGQETLTRASRQIVLYHLDRAWADHLAMLGDIREGIHLRALGQGPNPFVASLDPLTEFHAEAVPLFRKLLADVEEKAAETFEKAAITSDGADLPALGLVRPTATWTYLVKDNPFGTIGERLARKLSR